LGDLSDSLLYMSAIDDLIDRLADYPAVVVVGTGTGVGKTIVTGWLLGELSARDISTTSMKWVQTGLDIDPLDTLQHDHVARRIDRGYSPVGVPKDRTIYRLPVAASPHLAARLAGVTIDANRCWAATCEMARLVAPVLIEGAGGVMVPMTESETLLDWIRMWELPVIVVATDQLGTLNATALTVEAIERRRILILGIVVNSPDPVDTVVTQDNRRMVMRMGEQCDAVTVCCGFIDKQ